MFKQISRNLITGIITLLPVVLTIYLLYWLAVSSEQMMGSMLRWVLPGAVYFPGMGMLAGLLFVFVIGLLMNAYVVRQMFCLWEELLYKVPLVNNIYRALRDFFNFFSIRDKPPGQVVAVTYNGVEVIGFITQEDESRLPESFRGQGKVLVYIPMSYMIGGYSVFISRDQVRPLKMTMEEAIRFTLSAGIT